MSRWSDVVQFIRTIEGTDLDGFPQDIEILGAVIFANRKPVRSSEFYQAAQSGYQLEETFEVRTPDYKGEKVLFFENERYRIERTYKKTDVIELICSRFAVEAV